jgi:hypothetical protein
MRKFCIIFFILIFTTLPGFSQKQGELSKVGTGMAQFLKLSVGARAAALADAYSTAANDVTSLFWNPAGIQQIPRFGFAVSRYQLYADITHNFAGFVIPLNYNTKLGLHFIYLSSGDIEITTIDSPNGTGETYNTSNISAGLTISRRLTERFLLGFTVKYVSEKIYNESGSTFAFDVGSQFNTGIYGLKLGMALTNFGGKIQLTGPDLDITTENPVTGGSTVSGGRLQTSSWPIPLTYRLGIMMDIFGPNSEIAVAEKHRLTMMVDGNDPVDHYLRFNTGVEYEWNRILALRGGYRFNYDEATYTLGAGLNFNMGRFNTLQIDYAFGDFGLLGYVHQYALLINF